MTMAEMSVVSNRNGPNIYCIESGLYMFDECSLSGIKLQKMISLFTKLSPNPFPANMLTYLGGSITSKHS